MGIAIAILVVSLAIMTFLIVWGVKRHRINMSQSDDMLSDRDLLLLINAEPDRIINAVSLAKKSGMSLGQARTRLQRLQFAGVVNSMSSGIQSFYELKTPIDQENLIRLSDHPFISIEDLFTLFDHFQHKMSLQDICVATGLPFKVIKEEMKYFEKEGVVHKMTQHNGTGMVASKFYTLQDEYKNRGANDEENEEMNLDLKKIFLRTSRGNDDYV